MTRGRPALKLGAALLAACAALGVAAAVGRGDARAPAPVGGVQVRRGDYCRTVRATGALRARETTRVAGPPLEDETVVITDMVLECSSVTEGQTVVRLDTTALEAHLRELTGGAESAEAAVAAARAAYDVTCQEIDDDIPRKEAELGVARARLQALLDRPLPEERAAAEARLAAAEADLAFAEYRRDTAHKLQEEGAIGRAEVRTAEAELRAAVLMLAQMRKDVDRVLKGAPAEDVAAARAEAEGAEASLQEARDTRKPRRQQALGTCLASENALADVLRRKEHAETLIAGCSIAAPHDGIVIAVPDSVSIGDPCWHGRPLLDVLGSSALFMAAEVRERDSQLVKAGQAATVYLLAQPDVGLPAEVTQVAATLQDDESARGLRHLGVELEIKQVPDGVLPGMSGHADIVVESVPDALIVPRCAARDGVVHLAGAGGAKEQTVEIIATDGTLAAVSSGLSEGQWVQVLEEE